MADLELLQSRQVAQNFQQRIGKGASLEFDDLDRSRVVHDDVRAGIRDRQKGGALCRIGPFGLALVPTFFGLLYGLAGLFNLPLHSNFFAKLLGT